MINDKRTKRRKNIEKHKVEGKWINMQAIYLRISTRAESYRLSMKTGNLHMKECRSHVFMNARAKLPFIWVCCEF